jgi:hypothetical protein
MLILFLSIRNIIVTILMTLPYIITAMEINYIKDFELLQHFLIQQFQCTININQYTI